jgi:hypothetical protein
MGNGTAEMSATRPTLDMLRQTMSDWLFIPAEDRDMIDFILAVYRSHVIPGDPLWGLIIDASGGGKTELLRALRNRTDAYFLSKLTEKSLKSGYRDPKSPLKDPSLLPQLDGKVLIIKDLSPLLSMRRESRSAIIGDFRDAYDGFSDDGYGNVGRVGYQSRFSFLAASTLAIERFDAVDQELGERFIKYRGRGVENRSKVRRAIQNVAKDDTQRTMIITAINDFLNGLEDAIPTEVPTEIEERLIIVSDFIATARSAVSRDRNHNLDYPPRPEVGTRLGKELTKLLIALAHVRNKSVPDMADFQTVCRVGEDCLPPNRLVILRSLLSGRSCELPPTTAKHAKEDLHVLGILDADFRLSCRWKVDLRDVPLLFR